MDQIAFLSGETTLYWYSIILALACAAAVCFFWSVYIGKGGSVTAAAVTVPFAIVLSLVLSRLFHWYSRSDSYSGFVSAMTDYSSGGYGLLGCFGGCLLAAALVRLTRLDRNLPKLLDSMSVAAAGGIALGRLACFFSTADRGPILSSTVESLWVYPVRNAVSGIPEYRLATFVIQAMVTALIFAVLVVFSLTRERGGNRRADGEITLLFLLLYGAAQAVLDSTRYDSLFFRSNGFVSVVQVFSALAVGFVTVFYSIRLCRSAGFRAWYLGLWIPIGGLLGCAGYMEYYVQRHGDNASFSYTIMSLSLSGVVALALVIRTLAHTLRKSSPRVHKYLSTPDRAHGGQDDGF